jgi:hypothetical protein
MIIRILRLMVCAAFLAVVAAAQTTPLTEQIASRLTANALKADVSFLASDALKGRLTPSPELAIAAEFVAAQFRRAGLERAGDDDYFQPADFTSVTPNMEGLELSFVVGGTTLAADKAAVALPDFTALELKGVAMVKVPPSDPSALDALTPDQVRGKVLVIDSSRLGAAKAIRRLTPAAVIVFSPTPLPTNRPRLREASAAVPASWLPGLLVWDVALRTALAAATEATVSLKIPAPLSVPVKLRNVVGVLRGSDPSLKDTYVLLTTHYDHLGSGGAGEGDHIYNGANDNASGTASVIAIANALASLPQRPKRSIVFVAFFGEESGLLGSRYYADHPLFPLRKTVAQVNLECLGRTDDDSGPRVGQVNATGFDYTSITEVLRQAGEEAGIKVLKDDKRSDPYYGRSDNAPLAEAGVPAHTLSVGYVLPDIHKPGDEWPKLDYDNMAKVVRAVALGIYRLADSIETPQWNKQNPRTERYVRARETAVAGPNGR